MKTKEEIEEAIKELLKQERNYQLGGGGMHPSPYLANIHVLEWVIDKHVSP